MTLAAWVAAGYFVLTTAIGFIVAKRKGRKGGLREFFVAEARLPWYLIIPFLSAEYVSATATVGVAEMAHKDGVVAILFYLGAPLGLALLAFTMAKTYTSIRKITIGEAFGFLFDQKTRMVAVITLLISTTLTTGIAFIGLGAVLAPLFDIPYTTGVWLSTGIMVLLAVVGLRGIAWMNIVHFVTIIIVFAYGTVAALNAAGGLGHVLASLPPEHLDWLRPGWPTVAAWIASSTVMKLLSLIAVMGMYAAKDEKTAKIGAVSAGIIVLAIASMPMLIGLSAYVLMPDIQSRFALWEMGEHCGVVVSTMLSIGVIAAVISTTPGTLLAKGAIVSRDIFLVIRPEASEGAQMLCSRTAIVLLSIGTTFFALTQPSILGFLLKVVQVRMILAILLLVTVLWRRIHPTSAFWTGLVGCAAGFAWFFADSPLGMEPLWAGLGTGLVTLVITSLIKRPSPFRGTVGLEQG